MRTSLKCMLGIFGTCKYITRTSCSSELGVEILSVDKGVISVEFVFPSCLSFPFSIF